MNSISKIHKELESLATTHQAQFSKSLTPGSKPMLGVKVPQLRKIAKRIAKENYKEFLECCPDTYYEYELLQAFVIGYARDDIETILAYADRFVPKIHDWAVNDGFCQNFSIARSHRKRVWEWLGRYAGMEDEYSQRVVAVMLMSHFLTDEYIDAVLECMNHLKYDGYYTRMGVAWCVATAYAKYPDKTHQFLNNNELDNWTYNKSIQKMLESYRISDDAKRLLVTMKRRKKAN